MCNDTVTLTLNKWFNKGWTLNMTICDFMWYLLGVMLIIGLAQVGVAVRSSRVFIHV